MFDLIWPCAFPLGYAAISTWVTRKRGLPDFCIAWASGGGGVLIGEAATGDWVGTGIAVLNIAAAVICWWLSRRKRKRSPKLIGAKSRALLAAVVARMRETLKPRPVFKPAPGGSAA